MHRPFQQRVPLVRPPQFAEGGGNAAPFGGSGAPGMPQPADPDALARLEVALGDDERGRFVERIYRWPDFGAIVSGTSAPLQTIQVASNRSNFVRMVAIRGGLKNATSLPLTGLELAGLQLRLQANGSEDLTTNGQGAIPCEFDGLFTPVAPWLWFASPPRFRASDQIEATITNTFTAGGEGGNTLTPYLMCRMVDDAWWRALYAT